MASRASSLNFKRRKVSDEIRLGHIGVEDFRFLVFLSDEVISCVRHREANSPVVASSVRDGVGVKPIRTA